MVFTNEGDCMVTETFDILSKLATVIKLSIQKGLSS